MKGCGELTKAGTLTLKRPNIAAAIIATSAARSPWFQMERG
jgi:hypothetical protein